MSDENKINKQEQQKSSNNNEELLNSINKSEKSPEQEPLTESEPVAQSISEPEHTAKPAQTSPAESSKKKHAHTERTESEKKRHEKLLKHQALEKLEVKEVLVFFQKYAKPATIVIIGTCVLILANNLFKNNRLKKEGLADSALLRAQSASDYQDILDDYGSTPSAPLALMGLAQENFNLGQVDKADEIYEKFIKKYPKHEMTVQAVFNQIKCKEAKGQLGEAHLLYGEFYSENKSSYLAPVALLGKGRCLEALDMLTEAKLVYEDIVTFYPGSGWSKIAESNLNVIQNKLN